VPPLLEVGGLELPSAEFEQVGGSELGKLVEELRQRAAFDLAQVSLHVEGLEAAALAVLEDDASAGNPVGAFAADEVSDDGDGGPGVAAFVGERHCVGQVAEKRIEGGRGTGEQSDGVGEVVVHNRFRPGSSS